MRIYTLCLFLVFIGCQSKNTNTAPAAKYVYKSTDSSGNVLKAMGKTYSSTEVFADIKGEIYEKEMEVYELKMGKVKAELLKIFMESHPDKKGLSNDEFLEKHILSGMEPSEKDIMAFANERKIPQDQLSEEMKQRIKSYLSMELKKTAVDQWLAKQTQKNKVEIMLSKPERPMFDVQTSENDPTWGSKNAKVTIVEYSDFQCPFCAKGAERLQQIKDTYGKKVKVVFRHFPLPFHKHAKDAANAAMCAHEQGEKNFWAAHDHMFANQDKLQPEELKKMGKKLNLNEKNFADCINSNKYMAKIDKDMEDGKSVHVKSTPTFFVNGRLINGAQPFEVFQEEIERHL